MKANDTTLREFLEGTKQFIVPLFQRTYSWERKNIEQLLNDLLAVCDNEQPNHFFGSFVTMPIPTSASTSSKYTIIDGQQRLTTIGILLAAIRNRIHEIDADNESVKQINDLYLTNPYARNEKHKIVPTRTDRDVYYSIVDSTADTASESDRLSKAFLAIKDRLDQFENLMELEKMKTSLLTKFSIVDIRLERGDDPYLIFESLNATGTPLTQADLIRNYLFMGIKEENQLSIYTNLWLPLQNELGDKLEDFFRHYLAINGNLPNINRIYATFRTETSGNILDESLREENTIETMNALRVYSRYYYKLLGPKSETNQEIRTHIRKLNVLRLTTSYPLLLNLYRSYDQELISAHDFCKCLKLIETLVVRRAVCGIPTNVLNRYFPTIFQSLNLDDIVESLREKLINESGSRQIPDNDSFRRCLLERNLYGNRILRYILREIERFENRETEPLGNLEIEHIMPQTLTPDWKLALGENWELIYSKYLHTLGNLTLTGYNPEYSNKSFSEKRDTAGGFRDSGLQINRSLSSLDRWGKQEIEARANELADKALEIWKI